jgi:hypothetical protein
MDQKYHGDDEKTRESRFLNLAQWLTAKVRPKAQNSNIRQDGILSLGNFMLPGNLVQQKSAPYFRDNTQFPIYFTFDSFA